MRNPDAVRRFEWRLVQLGCPLGTVWRMGRELADHHEDLRLAAKEAGLSDAEAEARAAQSLGEPLALAERVAMMLRESSWWGRHPLIGFCLLPPLMILLIVASGLALEYGVGKLLLTPDRAAVVADGGPGFEAFVAAVNCLPALAITLTTLTFWRLARQSVSGLKWTLAACGVCALCGMFGFVGLKPHRVFVGMVSIPIWPHFLTAVVPALVAVGTLVWRRRLESDPARLDSARGRGGRRWAGMLLPCVLVAVLTGCASHRERPIHSRGWVGGEYKVARPQHRFLPFPETPSVVYESGFPDVIRRAQKSAIKITALDTNTPAMRGGLRAGDLVFEVNHRPVTSLPEFRRYIDRSAPGTLLPVKVYRDGRTDEYTVAVGRETYRNGGSLVVMFPSVVRGWDLWPNPGFSLVFLGYERNPGARSERGTKSVYDEEWTSWLGLFQVSLGKRIVARTNVAPEISASPPIAVGME